MFRPKNERLAASIETEEERRNHTVQRIAAGALYLCLCVSANRVIGDLPVEHREVSVSNETERPDYTVLPPPGLERCPAPTFASAVLAHELVMRGDAITKRKEWMEEWDIPSELDLASSSEEADAARFHMRKEAADYYRLTVHDSRPYEDVLWEDLRTHTADNSDEMLPTAEYLRRANEFLALYGAAIELPTQLDQDEMDLGVEPIAPRELEGEAIKTAAYTVMRVVATLPEEYVRQVVGLKKILFVSGEDSEIAGLAYMDDAHDTIVLHIHEVNEEVIRHEIMHLANAALCGGYEAAMRDPAYRAHNPAFAEPYGQENPVSHEDIAGVMGVQRKEEYVRSELFRHIATCLKAAKVAERYADVSLVSDYSGKNPVEDKAETGLYMLEPNGRAYMTGFTVPPRVRGKYETLLARLADAHPGIAGYFTAIQDLPDETSAVKC